MFQKTIKKEVSFSGIGLHTGQKTLVKCLPASIDTGVLFILQGKKILLSLSSLLHTTRSITLGEGKDHVMTVEHLASALYMKGITNIIIEMNNNEVPGLDGSALPFVKILKRAGIETQKKEIHPVMPREPVFLFEKDKFIMALPSDELKITYHIHFNHPMLRNRSIHFDHMDDRVFSHSVAPARTFGFEEEVQDLLDRGLARGGSLKNAVVLSKTGYLNKHLRFPDECIRHKVLDFIASLSFLEKPVHAHFFVYKSGHQFDLTFMEHLKKNVRDQCS